jgi:predicted nucleic acid-binding protein
MVIVDTNILIDHLRLSKKNVNSLLDRISNIDTLGISIVSVQELYVGKSMENMDAELSVLELLNSLVIFPYTYEISVLAGKLMRNSTRPLPFADSVIAATSIYHSKELFTLDIKDFNHISDLVLFDTSKLN